MIRDRIIEIIDFYSLSNEELERKTGINQHKWGNLKTKKQRVNEDHLEAIIKLWPNYAYWITTGKVIPEAGQISPEIEKNRQNLNKAG